MIGEALAVFLIAIIAQTIASGIRVRQRDKMLDEWRSRPPVQHVTRGGKTWEVLTMDDGHELWTPLHNSQRR
jgi:hypothetical protein